MRDLTDQSHANWIIAYQNMEKEWGIQALCGEGEYLYCMVSMVECGRVSWFDGLRYPMKERDGHIAREHRKMELPMWMKWDEMRWDEMRWSIGCIKQLALWLWLYVCNFIWDQRRLHRRNTWAWEIGILTLSKLYCYTSHWANAPDSSAIWMVLRLGLFGLQEHMGTIWEGNLLGNQWGWGPWNAWCKWVCVHG